MKKTLIVTNRMSGNADKADADYLRYVCARGEDVTIRALTEAGQDYDVDGFDKLIVCGGDGTFNVAVNKCKDRDVEVYCFPSGTLNEKAASIGENARVKRMGAANGELFTYVFATGSFTEIGYSAEPKRKKQLKKLAYVGQVFRAYRPFDIGAKIIAERTYEGRYSLVMAIDSDRCFGFRFNRAYKREDDRLYVLLIRNKGMGFLGKIRMFFPFFRAFFIGFNGEFHSKNIDFFPTKRMTIELENEQVFCMDGERREAGKRTEIEKKEIRPKVYVL